MWLKIKCLPISGGFDWDQYLKDCEAEAAPQSCFKQVIKR